MPQGSSQCNFYRDAEASSKQHQPRFMSSNATTITTRPPSPPSPAVPLVDIALFDPVHFTHVSPQKLPPASDNLGKSHYCQWRLSSSLCLFVFVGYWTPETPFLQYCLMTLVRCNLTICQCDVTVMEPKQGMKTKFEFHPVWLTLYYETMQNTDKN